MQFYFPVSSRLIYSCMTDDKDFSTSVRKTLSVCVVCLFACLFIHLFTFDLVPGDWSLITGIFYSNITLACVCVGVRAEVPTASPLLSCSDLRVISLQEHRCETLQWEKNEQLMSNYCYILDLQCLICPSDYSQTPSEFLKDFVSKISKNP